MADARRAALKDQTDISGARILIVEARFYDDIQDALLEGALAEIKKAKATHEIITVPGALEIPAAVAMALNSAEDLGEDFDAVIALGCVIRGGTPHFEYVCQAATEGVVQLNLLLPVPTIFGILTVDNEEQAKERIGGVHGHKGEEAALTAIKMISINQPLKK